MLVPHEALQLDEDIVLLMKSVLQNDTTKRPTALELLRHRVIIDGTYDHIWAKLLIFACDNIW